MNFNLTFHCEYCDEELGTKVKNGAIFHDEFHGCVGENFGLVASISGGDILIDEGVYAEVEQ